MCGFLSLLLRDEGGRQLDMRRTSFDHGSRSRLSSNMIAAQLGMAAAQQLHPGLAREDTFVSSYRKALRKSAEVVTGVTTIAAMLLLVYLHKSYVGKVR